MVKVSKDHPVIGQTRNYTVKRQNESFKLTIKYKEFIKSTMDTYTLDYMVFISPRAVHPAVSLRCVTEENNVQLLVKCVTATNVICYTCILHLKHPKIIIAQAL